MVQDASVGINDNVLLLILEQGRFDGRLVFRVMLAGLNFLSRWAGNVIAVEERGQAVPETVNEVTRVAHSVGV